MSSNKTWRRERVEFLLRELQFEITKGLIQDDLGDEYLFSLSWVSPAPKTPGYVLSRFEMRRADHIYGMDETMKSHKPKE